MSDGWGIAAIMGIVAAVLLWLVVGTTIGGDNYHRALCVERLSHAATPRDTLTIYRDDAFCVQKSESK